jgi:ElaB/YqjD/DUF883 family membrane-anchored ribosome-binding protein
MTATDTAHTLSETLQSAGHDAVAGVRRAGAAVGEKARVIAGDIEDYAEEAQDAATSGFSRLLESVEDAMSWTGRQVSVAGERLQERPLQTAAMALAAGALFGWFMRRR